uniref:TSA: Wollemia nobilis Ref_Wollemi_Transcript_14292_1499 transcribed RNA sequence n=1 Tax=Wollemia nobilis TaxID=56998 RepID=A0A0C9S6U8_9CONI
MREPEQKARQRLSVAYQGVPGAYSEEAAMAAHPGCQGVPCRAYEAAVDAVERRGADRAIIPIESTLEGTLHPNYDLLLDRRLHIVGEIHYPVQYCLLALPGVGRGEIRRVMSHPLAVSQCRRTLGSLGLASVSKETTDDTAGAAQHVARAGLTDTAAIASARAAEIYGLRVLARGIQDEPCNFARFLILARDPFIPTGDRPYKTSIVVAHDGELGVLFRVLSAFSFRDINLTKLESRPRRIRPLCAVEEGSGVLKPFQYVFYIDVEASIADRRVQNALSELKEFATFLRVLGSYPTDGGARV